MNAKQVLLAGLMLATVVFSPSNLPSCGGGFIGAVFTETRHPPAPIEDYARGRLGLLQKEYDRDYLVVAYRYLSGKPLTALEQKAIELPRNPFAIVQLDTPEPAIQDWLNARAMADGVPDSPRIVKYRKPQGNYWLNFLNCPDDSFRNASETLEARLRTFGPTHPGIKGWVEAQDAVFANCSGAASTIPAPPEDSLPQALKYDREYQIAAAHFYATHYDEAARRFRDIETERESPWSRSAPYLVARCLIRKAVVPADAWKFDSDALAQAEKELNSILQDPARGDLRAMARGLENYVVLRLHPLEYLGSVASRLLDPANAEEFRQDLVDYQYLLKRDWAFHFTSESARQTSDLSDWILTWGYGQPAYALERWQATGNVAWLLSAISKIGPGDPGSADLLAAAAKIVKDSPAYPTAQYHRIRVLQASGKQDEARAVLDSLLPDFRKFLDRSSLNAFLSQRMSLARNLDEFMEFAPRSPATLDVESAVPLLDADSVKVLDEELPLSFLYRAAMTQSFPEHLRKQLTRMVWVRAILIGDDQIARDSAIAMERDFPELIADLRVWNTANDDASRQFAAVLLMLRFPGMSPFIHSGISYRAFLSGIAGNGENWWCGFSVPGAVEESTAFRRAGLHAYEYKTEKKSEPSGFLSFLKEAEKGVALGQWRKLSTVETAPDYLGKIVLEYAAKHPGDARVPEALHLVVVSTRFGCNDADSGRYSQAAFALLQSKYKNTQWAKLTPFWYK